MSSDVLREIARRVPIFEHKVPLYERPDFWHDHWTIRYTPSHLRACTLVSRLWNTCFTPQLYHYYVDDHLSLPMKKDKRFRAFQKNSHLIRRFLSFSDLEGYRRRLPYDLNDPPKNLVGLFLHKVKDPYDQLIVHNQGSRLKQLAWTAEEVYRTPFMNLPCLEELNLRVTQVSEETLFRILSGCAGTLTILRLYVASGYTDKLFNHNGSGTSVSGGPKWTLPHVKSLQLCISKERHEASLFLPWLFPALENINVIAYARFPSLKPLTDTVRDYCPHIRSVSYGNQYYDSRYYPEPEDYAPLFKDSVKPQTLQRVSLGLPKGLDGYTMGALLYHVTTLVELDLWSTDIPHYVIISMEKLAVFLSHSRKLKALRIPRLTTDIIAMEELLKIPWRCQGLEVLVIEGFSSDTSTSRFGGVWPNMGAKREPKRRSGDPRRPLHLEYRDVGQGWYLRPGMDKEEYYEALVDSDWKSRLFKHMFTTSGVKNGKFVKLNGTEFFPQEQLA